MQILAICYQGVAQTKVPAELHPITYADFLTITLTALCVLLTALGVVVAVAAFWGYRAIKRAAAQAAKKAAEKAIADQLKQYPNAEELHKKFRIVDDYMRQLIQAEQTLKEYRDAPARPQGASKSKDVTKAPRRYPKKGGQGDSN